MPKAPVNGIELYYESHGDGPAVVFAHGAGGNHLSWWQQVPVFSRSYRCITFDHRGFGQSLNPPTAPGRDSFVDDLQALLDHLDIEDAFLVAQSMGGLSCLGFALAYPQRTRGLVLAGTTGGIGEPSVVEKLRQRNTPPDVMQRAVAPGFADREPAKAFLYRQINIMNPPRDLEPNGFTSGEGPKAPELAQMKVPTLFIAGSDDVVQPASVLELAHKLIPGSRMEIVDNAGHSTYFERPDIFNKLVLDFFAQMQAGSRRAEVASDG